MSHDPVRHKLVRRAHGESGCPVSAPAAPATRPVGRVTPRTRTKGEILAGWLSSTDHKVIGHMYLVASFVFFLCAGIMALLIRIQLLGPTMHIISDQQYNELFTMHGALMLLMFATPTFVGFAN